MGVGGSVGWRDVDYEVDKADRKTFGLGDWYEMGYSYELFDGLNDGKLWVC